jgi:hypothetical protein
LDGLDRDNEETNTGERPNEVVGEKIQSARNWFEILCGIGEDGDWPEERLRDFIRQDLHVLEDQISEYLPCSHFKRWPAVENAG